MSPSSGKNKKCWVIKWVFPKILVPQNGWFIMENPIKMGWFGGKHPYFWKHPNKPRKFEKVSWCIMMKLRGAPWGIFRSDFVHVRLPGTSQNHGSVKNGCISNSNLSNTAILHFHDYGRKCLFGVQLHRNQRGTGNFDPSLTGGNQGVARRNACSEPSALQGETSEIEIWVILGGGLENLSISWWHWHCVSFRKMWKNQAKPPKHEIFVCLLCFFLGGGSHLER